MPTLCSFLANYAHGTKTAPRLEQDGTKTGARLEQDGVACWLQLQLQVHLHVMGLPYHALRRQFYIMVPLYMHVDTVWPIRVFVLHRVLMEERPNLLFVYLFCLFGSMVRNKQCSDVAKHVAQHVAHPTLLLHNDNTYNGMPRAATLYLWRPCLRLCAALGMRMACPCILLDPGIATPLPPKYHAH